VRLPTADAQHRGGNVECGDPLPRDELPGGARRHAGGEQHGKALGSACRHEIGRGQVAPASAPLRSSAPLGVSAREALHATTTS
jgi:hypothetical protein